MYCYIYDKIASDSRYKRLVSDIENRLTDLGLQGEVERVTPIRTVSSCIELSAGRKCSTLVIVGDDDSFSRAITCAVNLGVVVGFIPIRQGVISEILGIPKGVSACEVLSKRKIEKVDLGKVEGSYFLTTAEISAKKSSTKNIFGIVTDSFAKDTNVKINIDGKFDVSSSIAGIRIVNMDPMSPGSYDISDGLLNLVIIPKEDYAIKDRAFKKGEWSAVTAKTEIAFKRASVFGPRALRVSVDGRGITKLPVNIEVAPKKLSVIVGGKRLLEKQ